MSEWTRNSSGQIIDDYGQVVTHPLTGTWNPQDIIQQVLAWRQSHPMGRAADGSINDGFGTYVKIPGTSGGQIRDWQYIPATVQANGRTYALGYVQYGDGPAGPVYPQLPDEMLVKVSNATGGSGWQPGVTNRLQFLADQMHLPVSANDPSTSDWLSAILPTLAVVGAGALAPATAGGAAGTSAGTAAGTTAAGAGEAAGGLAGIGAGTSGAGMLSGATGGAATTLGAGAAGSGVLAGEAGAAAGLGGAGVTGAGLATGGAAAGTGAASGILGTGLTTGQALTGAGLLTQLGTGIYGANQAADAQEEAARLAAATAASDRALQLQLYREDVARNKPFYDAGVRANAQLERMANGGYNMQESPAAQYQLTQGTRSLNRQLAARGLLGSGNASQRLAELSSGIAATDYNQQWNRLSDLVKGGTGASAAMGSSSQNYGSNINTTGQQMINASNQAGQGRAALYSGLGGVVGNSINTGINAYRALGGSGNGSLYDSANGNINNVDFESGGGWGNWSNGNSAGGL